MSRLKKRPFVAAAEKQESRPSSRADRSAYFARREAAKVLRTVLQGDAKRRAVGSIKSLVFSPSVRNKRGTFALVCETLKYLSIIKEVLGSANVLNSKWKRQGELIYIATYDILFGKAASLVGDAEKFLLLRKDALQSALAQLLVRKGMKDIKDLTACQNFPDISKPRYVRVNTLKLDLKLALQEFGKQNKVHEDDMVPDLLVLPPGVDLHNHPLVLNGSVFMQGKASSMAAAVLQPEPGWEVLDACAAPGNKTVHLAALMQGKGKIIACELHKERVQRLKETIKLAGAANVEVLNEDFLNLNPKHASYSKVRAILLDPSCSGSGTSAVRLDHLLPSHGTGNDAAGINRLRKLQAFQKKALAHALSFPAVERLVYSTCSVHQVENEDVIKSVLPIALSLGFQLATPFPLWARRGLSVVEGSEHLLRTDPAEDKEGFFIALFIRKSTIAENKPERISSSSSNTTATSEAHCSEKSSISSLKRTTQRHNNKLPLYCPLAKLSRMLLCPHYLARNRANRISTASTDIGDEVGSPLRGMHHPHVTTTPPVGQHNNRLPPLPRQQRTLKESFPQQGTSTPPFPDVGSSPSPPIGQHDNRLPPLPRQQRTRVELFPQHGSSTPPFADVGSSPSPPVHSRSMPIYPGRDLCGQKRKTPSSDTESITSSMNRIVDTIANKKPYKATYVHGCNMADAMNVLGKMECFQEDLLPELYWWLIDFLGADPMNMEVFCGFSNDRVRLAWAQREYAKVNQ